MLTVDEQFIQQHERLARYAARRFHPRNDAEFEEYFAWARLGLIQAAQRFDPQCGVKFSTFAFRLMTKYLRRAQHFCRTLLHVPHTKPLPDDLPGVVRFEDFTFDDGEGGDVLEALADATDVAQDAITQLSVRQAWRRLTPTERRLVWACLVEGHAQQEVAARLGVSRQAVHDRLRRACAKLRAALGGDNLLER